MVIVNNKNKESHNSAKKMPKQRIELDDGLSDGG